MIAQAAGLTAPIAVSTPVIANITHGISATLPRTAPTATRTIRSTVPFFLAIAKRYVTPIRVSTRSELTPATMSFSSMFEGPHADQPCRDEAQRAHVDRHHGADDEEGDQPDDRDPFRVHEPTSFPNVTSFTFQPSNQSAACLNRH